jgi:uncharacterized damage-inducible protein DinB
MTFDTGRRSPMLEALHYLYDYNTWAMQRVLEAAGRLRLQQFVAGLDGHDAIRDVLVHTVWAQWLWLERCQGNSPQTHWQPGEFPYVATLTARWREIDAATHEFLDSLTEADLQRVIAYQNIAGETWRYPVWKALLHQANHAQQHRSEAALLLTRAGSSPGSLDLLVFEDERNAGRG